MFDMIGMGASFERFVFGVMLHFKEDDDDITIFRIFFGPFFLDMVWR